MACINIPAHTLQILLNRRPEWRGSPVAVVTEEKPLGRITRVNRPALEKGVRVGMRYATALTIDPMLRAGVVDRLDIDELDERIVSICRLFSPVCEPASISPGVFWVDAAGLERLYESEYDWGRSLCAAIRGAGYRVLCAVGASRRGTFCNSFVSDGVRVFSAKSDELLAMRGLPLETVPLGETVLLRLRHLGITTVGAFLDLPASDIRSRFGEPAFALHLFLSVDDDLPLQAVEEVPVCSIERRFQEGVAGTEALLAVLEPMFEAITAIASRHGRYFNRIVLDLFDEEHRRRTEEILPAEPTRSKRTVLGLIGIRLESVRLETPVYRCVLSGDLVARKAAQEVLIGACEDRDGRKTAEVFAVIRAELGNDAIRLPVILDEHDPAKRVEWRPLAPGEASRLQRHGKAASGAATKYAASGAATGRAAPGVLDALTAPGETAALPVLCRRFLETPKPYRASGDPTLTGPYRLDGEWWSGRPGREYRFTVHDRKEIRWSFRADDSREPFLHGWIG